LDIIDEKICQSLLILPFLLSKVIEGRNVYGVFRAPQGDRTEALVFCTPLRAKSIAQGDYKEKNLDGIAFLLKIAEDFSGMAFVSDQILPDYC